MCPWVLPPSDDFLCLQNQNFGFKTWKNRFVALGEVRSIAHHWPNSVTENRVVRRPFSGFGVDSRHYGQCRQRNCECLSPNPRLKTAVFAARVDEATAKLRSKLPGSTQIERTESVRSDWRRLVLSSVEVCPSTSCRVGCKNVLEEFTSVETFVFRFTKSEQTVRRRPASTHWEGVRFQFVNNTNCFSTFESKMFVLKAETVVTSW